jgi:hypothetical protein
MKPILCVLVIVFLLLTVPVGAVQLSFVDRSVAGNQGFIIHQVNPGDPGAGLGPNVSYFGRFNSTSPVITLNNDNAYVLELYTTPKDYINSPGLLFTDPAGYAINNWKEIIVISFLVAMFITFARRK